MGGDLMARLDRLDVRSRLVFPGKLPGERRSKRRGRSVEFADYRTYTPGDDLRHIDWNVLARLDRLFIKLFLEEEDLSVHLAVDVSASMDAGSPSKLLFALRAAMALGYIGLTQRNRVSATLLGAPGGTRSMQEMRGRLGVQRLGAFLLDGLDKDEGRRDRPRETFADAMRRAAAAPSGTGVIIVISDFFAPEGWEAGLRTLAGRRGFDVTCMHVLSPGEIDPTSERAEALASGVVGDLRLVDVESGGAREVSVSAALLQRYRVRLEAFCAGLEQFCVSRAMTYLLVRSDEELESLLLDRLRARGLLR